MVGVVRRMNKLNAKVNILLGIRHGPGAAILPATISRIHMEFAHRGNDGHYGPRKFWQHCLPRLKYWNPSVPMIVNRTTDQAGPAAMTIYFHQVATSSEAPLDSRFIQASSSTTGQSRAPEPSSDERVVTIEMKHQHSTAILDDFLGKTGAVPITPNAQEEAEMREVKEKEVKAAVDRDLTRKFVEANRREAALMKQARNETAAAMKEQN